MGDAVAVATISGNRFVVSHSEVHWQRHEASKIWATLRRGAQIILHCPASLGRGERAEPRLQQKPAAEAAFSSRSEE